MISIEKFHELFSDNDQCLEYIRNCKYPQRISCPKCKRTALFHRVSERKSYACGNCGHQISPTAGTIFHKSRTPLTVWFYVIYRMTSSREKVTAKQIQRETNVTYKTAWRMCNLIGEILVSK